MQITRAADYAVRVMIQLAQSSNNEPKALGSLALATESPESFLSKVLQCLCRAGFVTSRRGQVGGFTILPAGRDATIAAVIQAVDGPFHLNVCLSTGPSCERKACCPAHPVWVAAQEAMVAVLRAHTVSELAATGSFPTSALVRL
jgi:Rrf2 family protein